jgi:hypothetical protein
VISSTPLVTRFDSFHTFWLGCGGFLKPRSRLYSYVSGLEGKRRPSTVASPQQPSKVFISVPWREIAGKPKLAALLASARAESKMVAMPFSSKL